MLKCCLSFPLISALMTFVVIYHQEDKKTPVDKEEEIEFSITNKSYYQNQSKSSFKSIDENFDKIKTTISNEKEWLELINILKDKSKNFPAWDFSKETILVNKIQGTDNYKSCNRIIQNSDKIKISMVEHINNNPKDGPKYVSIEFIKIPRTKKQVEFITLFSVNAIHDKKHKYKPQEDDKKIDYNKIDVGLDLSAAVSLPNGTPWIITSDDELKIFLKANEKAITKPFEEKIDFSKKILVVTGTSVFNNCGCKRTTGNIEAIENKSSLLFNFTTSGFGGGAHHKCTIKSKTLHLVICDKIDKKIQFNITNTFLAAP